MKIARHAQNRLGMRLAQHHSRYSAILCTSVTNNRKGEKIFHVLKLIRMAIGHQAYATIRRFRERLGSERIDYLNLATT